MENIEINHMKCTNKQNFITIKKKISYIFSSAIYAFGIFMLTRLIYYVITDRNVLAATIGNIILIIYFVITEKIEEYIFLKIKSKSENTKISILKKVLITYLSSSPYFQISNVFLLYLCYYILCTFSSIS